MGCPCWVGNIWAPSRGWRSLVLHWLGGEIIDVARSKLKPVTLQGARWKDPKRHCWWCRLGVGSQVGHSRYLVSSIFKVVFMTFVHRPGKKKTRELVLNFQFEDTSAKVSCGTIHSGCRFTNNSAGIPQEGIPSFMVALCWQTLGLITWSLPTSIRWVRHLGSSFVG